MDIDAYINEHIQRLQDLNKQMGEIGKKIGALQEEGRALHNAALEVKGAIEGLAKMKAKEEQKAKEAAEKAKGLILPDKSLVAPDGKTPITAPVETPAPAAEATPEAPKAETPVAETPAAPVALEVK
jgi:hypothetical protein